jgi:hypothetical protein
MKISTLLRKCNAALRTIEVLDPEQVDERIFKMQIDKARAIAYLIKTQSEIINLHEEKRSETFEINVGFSQEE